MFDIRKRRWWRVVSITSLPTLLFLVGITLLLSRLCSMKTLDSRENGEVLERNLWRQPRVKNVTSAPPYDDQKAEDYEYENIIYNIVDVYVRDYLENDSVASENACQAEPPDDQLIMPDVIPLIALASYPRSGNKFTRQTLYRTTQKNKIAYKKARGLLLNDTETDRICYKTHEHDPATIQLYTGGAILLLRDPRYVATSYFLWFYTRGEHTRDLETLKELIKTNDDLWKNWTNKVFTEWRQMNIDWITQSPKVLVSYTEDIARDPVREISRMIKFAGEGVPIQTVKCTLFRYPWISQKHLDFEPKFPEELLRKCLHDVNTTLLSKDARPLPKYPKTYL